MADLLGAYRRMLLIRIAEEDIAKLYLEKKIMSFVHFSIGQEAVAVGVCDALTSEDRVVGNHRSHGHYLAKGGDLKKMVCELLGKKEGLARGKGGSMHMIDKSVNFIGGTPLLGSAASLACGTAFEKKYSKKEGIAVGFYGDGASEEGIVYETLNLAALFKLPLLLVIENNLYSVNSKLLDRRSPLYDVEKIVMGIGLSYARADGNDYDDVSAKARALAAGAREGKPGVLECMTYRHMAHSAPLMDDAQGYREEDVLEKRLEKDSLKKMKNALLQGGTTEEELVAIESEIRTQVGEAIRYAENAPYPDSQELYTDLYHV